MSIRLNQISVVAFAAATLITLGVAVPTTHAQSNNRITLDPGTVIPVTLNDEISSDGSSNGDTFTATVDANRNAYSPLSGATVDGVVKHATAQSGSNPGTLELTFTRVHMPDGTTRYISGSPTSLDQNSLTVRGDGVLVAKKASNNKNQPLTYAGIGAGAGALISILHGGKFRIEDVLLGGGLGYAAGALLKHPDQVHDVDLKPGTAMGVLLKSRVLYHRHYTGNNGNYGNGNNNGNGNYNGNGNNSNLKYYMYNGERWALDRSTGARFIVSSGQPTYHRVSRKYYTYNGHPFYLDLNTGERVQMD